LQAQNAIDKGVARRGTSLEAAFIDRFKAGILLITIYQALPKPGVKLYRECIDFLMVGATG
jgi:hypothetical protein